MFRAQAKVISAQRLGASEVIYAATESDAAGAGELAAGEHAPENLQLSFTISDADAHGSFPPGAVVNVTLDVAERPDASDAGQAPGAAATDTTTVTGDPNTPPATAPPAGDGTTVPGTDTTGQDTPAATPSAAVGGPGAPDPTQVPGGTGGVPGSAGEPIGGNTGY